MTGSPSLCVHCRDPNPVAGTVNLEREGEILAFCCAGCRTAYRIITEAGLEDFYARREWEESGTPAGAFETGLSDEYLGQFVRKGREGEELSILVQGVRCASCVWVIEKILARVPGIRKARLSNTTHILKIIYDGQQIRPSQVLARVAELGYSPRPYTALAAEEAAREEMRSLLIRFGTAVFLSMQLMGYSLGLYAGYFQGISEEARVWLQYLAGLVSTPVVFYCGAPFLTGAVRSIANRAPDMDLLVATGVLSAWSFSVYSLVTGGEVYFDSAAMIVTFLLLGRLLEAFARRRAASGVSRILRLAPETATRITGNGPEEVPTGALEKGDHIVVKPGERFPADGVILSGTCEVDEAAVTGEPIPVVRSTGEKVVSGTVNLTQSIDVEVTEAGAASFISRMAQLVQDAQARKPPVQEMADRVAARFVPLVMAVALGTLIFWSLKSGFGAGPVLAAVSVLIVACPCALGLATPTAVVVASGAAAGRGILYKGGDVIQEMARVDTAALDKTGTLTKGEPQVVELEPAPGMSEERLLEAAATVESGSAHPIARAILQEAGSRGIMVSESSGRLTVPGRGVQLVRNGERLLVGSRQFLAEKSIDLPKFGKRDARTEALVADGEICLGRILLDDPLREEARPAVEAFQRMVKRVVILSGDRPDVVKDLARDLGIGEGHGSLTPGDKAGYIARLQEESSRVLMVGDGINDAPALAEASVGSAVSGGSDIALEVSDIVLTLPRIDIAARAMSIARRTLRVIRQNLVWAFVYNIVALGMAAAGKLEPIHAAAAMAASSICVVGNSMRLARIRES